MFVQIFEAVIRFPSVHPNLCWSMVVAEAYIIHTKFYGSENALTPEQELFLFWHPEIPSDDCLRAVPLSMRVNIPGMTAKNSACRRLAKLSRLIEDECEGFPK